METGYIYILKWRTVFKIGCTNDVERRMKQNLRKKPDAKLVRVYKCDNYNETETYVHRVFDKCRVCGNNEWFCFTDEEFSLILCEYFKNNSNHFERVI